MSVIQTLCTNNKQCSSLPGIIVRSTRPNIGYFEAASRFARQNHGMDVEAYDIFEEIMLEIEPGILVKPSAGVSRVLIKLEG